MSITKLGEDELVSLGARYRACYLTAQGRHTLGLVREYPEVAELAGTDFLAEAEAAVARLEEMIRDRDLAAAESKDSARGQGDAVQAAKIWRRAFINRALAARLRGTEIPAEAGNIQAKGQNPGALARDLERLVGLGREHRAALSIVGITEEFLARGEGYKASLVEADQKQELIRLKKLPDRVQEMHRQKALVYLATKQLNHLGRSAFAEDSGRAGRYNLDILYRRVRSPSPTTASPATAGAH